ncbi:hypothetical protein [Phenylobacterium sp.]|jgi:hypothetical protein|uniref:hypothetical protein n=1 Tax=Phenylobacterium sp. TaxID=1871053 RepID=UPI00378432BB
MIAAALLLALAAPGDPPPAGARAPAASPAAQAAAKSLSFEPKTQVENNMLQVVVGQRAVFTIEGGRPKLEKVEDGRLAAAHSPGKVKETFAAPATGQVAAAFDASSERKVSVLKVWNAGTRPLDFRLIALALANGKLTPVPINFCAVAPGGVRSQEWPAPILAVALSRFTTEADDPPACRN